MFDEMSFTGKFEEVNNADESNTISKRRSGTTNISANSDASALDEQTSMKAAEWSNA